jgi:hypothetical protein
MAASYSQLYEISYIDNKIFLFIGVEILNNNYKRIIIKFTVNHPFSDSSIIFVYEFTDFRNFYLVHN